MTPSSRSFKCSTTPSSKSLFLALAVAEVHGDTGAFANLPGERLAGILFTRDASHLALAVLNLAQLAKDRCFLRNILFFSHVTRLEPHLQLEQALFYRRIVGVLL